MSANLPCSVASWHCRVCGFDRYHQVTVMRKSGSRYETNFSACSGCSVMFLNPTRFNVYARELPSVVTPLKGA